MLQNTSVQVILTDIDELRDLLQVIGRTSDVPEVLFKLAEGKAVAVTNAVRALRSDMKYTECPETESPGAAPVTNVLSSMSEISVSSVPDSILEPENELSRPFILDVEAETKDNGVSKKMTASRPESGAVLKTDEVNCKSVETAEDEVVVEKISIADTVSAVEVSLDMVLQRKQAKDIRKAMTLNDKFRFRRELFLNSDEVMNATIDAINEISGFPDACSFLQSQFTWDPENQTVVDFMAIVEKKYL